MIFPSWAQTPMKDFFLIYVIPGYEKKNWNSIPNKDRGVLFFGIVPDQSWAYIISWPASTGGFFPKNESAGTYKYAWPSPPSGEVRTSFPVYNSIACRLHTVIIFKIFYCLRKTSVSDDCRNLYRQSFTSSWHALQSIWCRNAHELSIRSNVPHSNTVEWGTVSSGFPRRCFPVHRASNPPPALEITMLMLYLVSFQRVNGRLKDTALAALIGSDVWQDKPSHEPRVKERNQERVQKLTTSVSELINPQPSNVFIYSYCCLVGDDAVS